MRRFVLGIALLAGGLFAGAVKAETNYIFDFGVGYQKLAIDGVAADDLDGDENVSGRFKVMFIPGHPRNPWRMGFSIGGASAIQDVDPFVQDGETFTVDPFKEIEMLFPEFRVAYHMELGSKSGFYIEPSIGVGPAFALYRAGNDWDDWDDDEETVRVNICFEPTIQVGWGRDNWSVGAEASYLWTRMDFGDDVGGDIELFYLGGFFRAQF